MGCGNGVVFFPAEAGYVRGTGVIGRLFVPSGPGRNLQGGRSSTAGVWFWGSRDVMLLRPGSER